MPKSSNAFLIVGGIVTIALAARLTWDAMRPVPGIAASVVPVSIDVVSSKAVALVETSYAKRYVEVAQPTVVTQPSVADRASTFEKAKHQAPPAAVTTASPTGEPIFPLEVARAALDAVGDDPVAGQVWFAAINDPSLSPHDRSDLIEDLNENGFADPDHVTPDELPLVLARLDLIEQVAPDAMDDVNAAAFAEAYKDLSNIANRLTR